jgi:hypothetical protein
LLGNDEQSVDAATFAFSFVTVLLFVPARKRAAAPEESGGLLTGMSFLPALTLASLGVLVSPCRSGRSCRTLHSCRSSPRSP